MSPTPLHVCAWAAWAPGLPDRRAWSAWLADGTHAPEPGTAKPACADVPAMIRRRCGLTARMVMETAPRACAEAGHPLVDTHLVFGSPNGENHALKALLEDLSDDDPLSPTAFTNSLHHVPTGYLSIVHRHTGISRTVSAFEDTFTCAWLDTAALLHRRGDRPALLIMADELPPEPFDRMLEPPPFSYAVSLLLRPAAPGESGVTLSPAPADAVPTPGRGDTAVFDFLRWYDGAAAAWTTATSFGAMTWRKH